MMQLWIVGSPRVMWVAAESFGHCLGAFSLRFIFEKDLSRCISTQEVMMINVNLIILQ